MNVLLTCAGRRSYLIEAFRAALAGRGQVFAADASPHAPALQEADRGFHVPRLTDPHYVAALLRICEAHQVGLLVPQSDLDLALLARDRARFRAAGTFPLVSRSQVISTCWDKWAAAEFLKSCGISTPRTFLSLEEARRALARRDVEFPVVVKPRWGAASFGVHYPESERELELTYELLRIVLGRSMLAKASEHQSERAVVIQERIAGQEHGLDIVNDLQGSYVATFARRKLGMRAGETECAVTVIDSRLETIGRVIGRRLGHIGSLDCDVFVSGESYSVLEMNPRFGGGYPFSHLAGANLPAALIAWMEGRTPDPAWFWTRPGVTGAKGDILLVQGGGEVQAPSAALMADAVG